MADNKSKGRAADRKRLNMSEPYEVAYAKSERASPARKALLAKGRAAKTLSSGRSTATARAGTSAKRTPASTANKVTAKKASGKTSSAKSSAKKPASPATKRTNVEPQRKRAARPSVRGTPKPPKAEKTAENTAPKTMKVADAVDLLTDDHLQVGTLFKQYEKLAEKDAPSGQRRTLAQTICDMLKAHTTIEDEIFYPAARKAGIDADLIDEADIEHASAKELIAQIEAGNPDDDHYDAKVKVLGDYVTHHVVEEHTEMFTKCRRSGMDLVALRHQLAERKMSILPGADAGVEQRGAGQGKPGLLAKIGDSLFAKS